MSFFKRKSRRVPYTADNTTWTCLTCMQPAWILTDGSDRGCGCGNDAGPRPLMADDPDHWSNQGTPEPDSRDELIATLTEQLDLATTIATRQAAIVQAARHLMDVFVLRDSHGPVFKLADDSEANCELIRHATLNLHSALNGAEPPAFCLPERTN